MIFNPSAQSKTGHKWVVFATWDATGAAAPHVVAQLSAYRELGFETLIIDASPLRSHARETDWAQAASAWRSRMNIGYDFGSYLHGMTVLVDEFNIPIEQLSVLLTNDSCYGPYTPLTDVFARFDKLGTDAHAVFGITDSNEYFRHLQSYWLYFPTGVAQHALNFHRSLPAFTTRDDAVNQGELGLSAYLCDHGCELIAWQTSAQLVQHYSRFHGRWLSLAELSVRWVLKRYRYTRRGDRACLKGLLNKPFDFNPTIAFGTHMHFDALTPFVKRALLRDNANDDPFVPSFDQGIPVDNEAAAEVLSSTDQYRRRYRRRRAEIRG